MRRRPRPLALALVLVLALFLGLAAGAPPDSGPYDPNADPDFDPFSDPDFDPGFGPGFGPTRIRTSGTRAPSASSASAFKTSTTALSSTTSPAAATAFAITTTATTTVQPAVGGLARGPLVAAAVGGSIASSLVVLAGTLFCFFHRARPVRSSLSGSALRPHAQADADAVRALEAELAALRARVASLEARVDAGTGAGLVLYTNEKDAEELDKRVAGGGAGDALPVYVD
ncbi:hypothetical protein B0H15DRAFT_406891 [Mycena belliarum]|uniref:Uncharacterized protein n=1 Tax=Mycena belliarum TaxID=1033014 RepID=A0AAD6UH49_9AGAR|nr:hypothetical protein B0H15DRAFT_406891 [Mycena belliae]